MLLVLRADWALRLQHVLLMLLLLLLMLLLRLRLRERHLFCAMAH